MTSMVLELQWEAYEQNKSVSILLRKAYTLSKKLGVVEFEKWAELELNGYSGSEQPVPSYREVHGEIKAFNPYVGYIPAYFHPEIAELISKRNIFSPITEIEEQVKQGEEKGKGTLMYKFPSETQMKLMEMMEVDFEVSLHISTTQFSRILDRVRNIILEWTLELENKKVLGEGMTFTQMEKKNAANTVGTIINVIGQMDNSQIQQNTVNSTQFQKTEAKEMKEELKAFIDDARKLIEQLSAQEQKDELNAEISVLESQINSPKPKNRIICEALKSIRNIAEGTTGSLIASAVQSKIATLLQLMGV